MDWRSVQFFKFGSSRRKLEFFVRSFIFIRKRLLWEEIKYIKQEKINIKPKKDGSGNGIIEIPTELSGIECRVIGNQKAWIRKCPECKSEIILYDKWYCEDAYRRMRLCKHCRIKGNRNPNFGITKSILTIEKIKNTWNQKLKDPKLFYWYKKPFSVEHKNNISRGRSGILHSKEWINNHRVEMMGNSYRKGIKHTLDDRRKIRVGVSKYIQRIAGDRRGPSFNERACYYFDWLNKWNTWNGQYATNKGEYLIKNLGYWVDYYEPKENIVIEWDEKYHYRNGSLREKDISRMNEIKNYLKCKFFRYNETTNQLKEY
jgi:hypothetical protein